ncbi:MAG TPA: class I SAM-dependent methyltransferase [Thermoanaerobaculia bacterium]|nr:class I SAM-dependent methyltransferase [Thermoanaerobaculia bacterium]
MTPRPGLVRRAAKACLPAPVRRFLRLAAREAPFRLRDLPADVGDLLGRTAPLPPARLRRRVSRTSSRREFEDVGRNCAAELVAAFARARRPGEEYRRWLDFGSGAGRIARYLAASGDVPVLVGVDVDGDLVAWTDRHLSPSRFRRIPPLPPTDLPDAGFDVAVCVSVFTHFDEEIGRRWIAELGRVLRPGGIFVVSTHGAAIAASQPLSDAQRERFSASGFLFIRGGGTFNDDAAFHAEPYLRRVWSEWFEFVERVPQGLMGFQDLSVWKRK